MQNPCSWHLTALVLLAGTFGQVAAQEPLPVYVKVDLDPGLIDFKNPNQRLKEVGEEIIRAIRDRHFYPYFSWRLEATDPSDNTHFPELRVFVKLDTNLDNWYMYVTLTMAKAPQAFAKELEPKELLKSGSLAAGLYPAGTARRKQMAEWFLEHFVKPADKDSLRFLMSQKVPLSIGRIGLATMPPLARGEAIVLLPYDQFWHLGESRFRLITKRNGQTLDIEPFRGKAGAREVKLPPNRVLQGLLIQYEKNPQDLQGISDGIIYLKDFVDATPPPSASAVLIAE